MKACYRIYLMNSKVILQHCGFGEGSTQEIAIQNALEIAKRTDSNAYYDKQTNTVVFEGKVYL